MSNMDSGLKDKIIGKAQKTKGKVKAKTKKVKDDIEADHQIDEDC